MIFVVPPTNETLRVAGRAELIDDPDLCQSFVERGKPALLVMRIRVSECYFHCAKAFLRSDLWNPTSWPEPVRISFGEEIASEGGLASEEIATFDAGVQGRYRTDL
jgi:predicted pyridoxine 5'-phosphate oxidase superfamily flavin-nucleotide-binding protein